MDEIWKKIPDLPDEFEASNLGRIRRTGGTYETTFRGKPLVRAKKPKVFEMRGKSSKGYLRVNIDNTVYMAHRLVAKTFIPNPDNLPQVNHKNGIKTDNRIDNLEWVTNQENRRHAVTLGLHVSGERCKAAKMTAARVLQLRDMAGKYTQDQIAAMFGLVQQTVSKIITGKTWKAVKV